MLKVARQLPRIRTSNPITRGLRFAYLTGSTVNLVRPHEVARVTGGAGKVRNSLQMTGVDGNGLVFGSGGLLGPLNNSTVVCVGTFADGYRSLYCERSAGNEIYKLESGRLLNGGRIPGVQFTYRNSGGTLAFAYADVELGGGPKLFAAIKTGGFHEVWAGLVGRAGPNDTYGTANFGGDSTFSDPSVLRTHGYDAQDPQQPLIGTSDLLLGWDRSLTVTELQQIRANPGQLFDFSSLPVFTASKSAAAITLSGSATAVASAYGALTSAIPLAGSAQASAVGAGTLATSIQLSSTAVARAAAAGDLSTSIALAGAAVASTVAVGALAGSGVTLVGTAVASASATGTLSTAIPLAGTARAEASASGALAGTTTGLSGTARVTASAAGALSTSIRLAGAAAAVASAYGSLATRITLGGAVAASAVAIGALSVGKPSAPIDISKVSPSRIVVFEGSGSRIVVFEGSGKRMRFDEMSAKVPVKVNGKWMSDRDPDEESYYAADVTDEFSDRHTTLAAGGDAIELILQGVTQLEAHSVQVANVDGVDRTYIVVLLGGVEGDLPKEWFWCARVKCANGERFDKTTWFNRVDT